MAVDKRTGKELWKVERPAGLKSYSTPLVIDGPQPAVVVNSTDNVEAFDPASGKSLWKFVESTRFAVPMPVYHDGVLYVSRGYRSGPYWAMKLGETGEVPKARLAWHVETGAPYTSSMVYDNGLLFMATEMGIVTCIDAKTGERVWRERLGGIYSASPVAADGKIYLSNEDGEMLVVAAGNEFKQIAASSMGETLMATPAISEGVMYVRGRSTLFAIGRR
jgi:outer membrane protein assembly factor BamB